VLQGLHRLWPPLIEFVRSMVDDLDIQYPGPLVAVCAHGAKIADSRQLHSSKLTCLDMDELC
jgi:hypothetical protein